jgi:hypothetical protein
MRVLFEFYSLIFPFHVFDVSWKINEKKIVVYFQHKKAETKMFSFDQRTKINDIIKFMGVFTNDKLE